MSLARIKTTWAEQIAGLLSDAATEIGEFHMQLMHEKIPPSEAYEKMKHQLRTEFSENGSLCAIEKRKFINLDKCFREIHLQLSLGKAQTLRQFRVQKKNINEALIHLANEITIYPKDDAFRNAVRTVIEVTRIKLEILFMHYKFSEMDREGTTRKVLELNERAESIRENGDSKERIGNLEWEIETTFKQMKDSFT